MIEGREGHRHILQILPTPGLARDVFGGAAAVAVLIGLDDRMIRRRIRSETLRSLFALTEREIEIAVQIAEGLDIAAICEAMEISLATGRSYLKSIFEKTGVHRQAELAALIARIML
jgi:DNA-binding CsgD family transcriptional regulator